MASQGRKIFRPNRIPAMPSKGETSSAPAPSLLLPEKPRARRLEDLARGRLVPSLDLILFPRSISSYSLARSHPIPSLDLVLLPRSISSCSLARGRKKTSSEVFLRARSRFSDGHGNAFSKIIPDLVLRAWKCVIPLLTGTDALRKLLGTRCAAAVRAGRHAAGKEQSAQEEEDAGRNCRRHSWFCV